MAMNVIITSVLAITSSMVFASDLFTYQGKLTDASDLPLPNGQYRIGMRIWENAAPPAQNPQTEVPLWARKYDVPVENGVFSLMVGAPGEPWSDPEPLTASLKLALSSGNRHLDITVMSDANGAEKPANQWQTLAPRQSLNAVPYAMNGVPTGTVVPFAGATAPEGWLICDGTTTLAIDDPRYRQLHAALGSAFNTGGEPAGHFRLPDMRGRTAIGSGQGLGLSSRLLAQVLGAETHTLTIAQMPSHNHGFHDPGHIHQMNFRVIRQGTRTDSDAVQYGAVSAGDGRQDFPTKPAPTGIQFQADGSNQPHNNMQPSLVLNYIIKL